MKSLFTTCTILLLTGCSLTASRDLKQAESLLTHFECNNVESAQMAHTSITSFHEEALATSRQKAEYYVQRYKDGEKLFDIPLSEIVGQQFILYQAACQNLGGILSSAEKE